MLLQAWRQRIESAFLKAGFDNARQEAKWLMAAALQRESAFVTLNPTYDTSPAEDAILQDWLARRLAREPLSRIKGEREFWSLPFWLNAHTLDPRPETEMLVEGVLRWVGLCKDNPWHILDLGTGSGCLLIALLHELQGATGVGVDISEDALQMARANAVRNNVETRAIFQQSNWGENVQGQFGIIVSNPPYIPLKERDTLAVEVVGFDPPQALFGGEDGLDCYRHLVREIRSHLAPQGLAVLEFGAGQRRDVEKLFQEAGFQVLFVLEDLAARERGIGVTLGS